MRISKATGPGLLVILSNCTYREGNQGSRNGNRTIFTHRGLGVISILYGSVFMAQKWIFYRQSSEEHSPLIGEQVFSYHRSGGGT